jgi:hypothetical protein
VLGADGKLRGVLCVRMSWGWARRMVQTVFAPAGQQYAADIFVVRNDGIAILGPQGMEDQRHPQREHGAGRQGQRRAQGNRADGRDYLTGYARTGTPGDPATLSWTILAASRKSLALSGARALGTRSCCWAPSSAP